MVQVLVSMRAAPISPADLYTARSGGRYGPSEVPSPFVAGMDGVGVIAKVSPGLARCPCSEGRQCTQGA